MLAKNVRPEGCSGETDTLVLLPGGHHSLDGAELREQGGPV